MEVYAGYQENADWNVGRLLDAIGEMGDLDNTLIFYIWGDNGASMEGTLTGSFNETTFFNGLVLEADEQLKLIEKWGGIEEWGGFHTAPHFAAAWAPCAAARLAAPTSALSPAESMKRTWSRSATSGRPPAASSNSRSRSRVAVAMSISPATVTIAQPRSCRASMISASPMASLPPGPASVPPGPASVLPEPGRPVFPLKIK